MQTQGQRQQTAVSPQQSLAVVKTLLSASFGCIAYLRNLLPDDNFGEGRLTAGERGSLSYGSSPSQESTSKKEKPASGIAIKTVTRGFSTEADKLLNYLEYGIFDAIEHQYLKSFIFAIYLDSEDPNNIIEAYTYNLTYYTVPGTDITVPIMTLDDQLSSLSLAGKSKNNDPVAQSILKGKAPTLGDVKQSVKALVKNLILATQALEPLPKRRFANFKLFYTEKTPPGYEPPYFRPGDPLKDRYIFTTHNKSEVPEKISIGSVVTPHHGVDLHVQSVAKYIPNGEQNDSQFTGFVSVSEGGRKGPVGTNDPSARSKQIDTQRKDAEDRVVVWHAEDPIITDPDAEGEEDLDFVNDSGIALGEPVGMRQADGSIVPLVEQPDEAMETDGNDHQVFGRPEPVPSHIRRLRGGKSYGSCIEPTQQLEETQAIIVTSTISNHDTQAEGTNAQGTVLNGSVVSRGVDTQMIKQLLDQNSAMEWTVDNDMLDMETQPSDLPIQKSLEAVGSLDKPGQLVVNEERIRELDDADCACGLPDGDDLVQCDGPCNRWLHLWCMGYHSPEDPRLPESYICIPCRLQGDANFHLIKDVYPDILTAFSDTALFRRAVKLAERHNPAGLREFRKVVGCGATLAQQLWKRLEREGFITLEESESDKFGLLETSTRGKHKSIKKVKSTKRVQKYVFVEDNKNTTAYIDYFNPDSEAEKDMLGLKKKGRKSKSKNSSRVGPPSVPEPMTARNWSTTLPVGTSSVNDTDVGSQPNGTQTQDDTQFVAAGTLNLPSDLKRRVAGSGSSQDTVRANKKVKISVGEGVDIEE